MSIIYLLLILADAQAFRLIDEDDSWLDHDDPPHSYVNVMLQTCGGDWLITP